MKVDIERRRLVFDDFFRVEEAVHRFERYGGAMSEPVRRLSVERVFLYCAFVDAKTLVGLLWLLARHDRGTL